MKRILILLVVTAVSVATFYAQPATHDRNNPLYKTTTQDTGFFKKGAKIYNIYVDSASLDGMLNGQTLVLDTSGGRRRLVPGASGAGSITVTDTGDNFPGTSQVNYDSNFNVEQSLAGQVTVKTVQPLTEWSQPSFQHLFVQPNGGVVFRTPDGLQTGTLYLDVGLPPGIGWKLGTLGGTIVSSAVAPFTISVGGQLGFSGAWTVPQGGTGATVAPTVGSAIWYNGAAYAGVVGTSGYFYRFGGSGAPTAYNLFGGPNTWAGKQTVTNAIQVDTLLVGTRDSTIDWRGDGKLFKSINRTTTFTSDTAIINIPGIDSTYDATWGFIGKSGMLATAGGKCYNNGNVELTSSTSPMVGTYVWYRVWKRN